MKGQVSLEMLIVMLMFLAALALWLEGMSNLTNATNKNLDAHANKIAADRLASTANSLCLMGKGNQRELHLFFPKNTSILYNDSLWIGSFQRDTYCPVNVNFQASGSVQIKAVNNGSIILQLL
ncbi:hypothetical protein K8R43_01125 [archaeon]|nr:hypothetical protein [archaeon]